MRRLTISIESPSDDAVDPLMLLDEGFPGTFDRRVACTECIVQIDRRLNPCPRNISADVSKRISPAG